VVGRPVHWPELVRSNKGIIHRESFHSSSAPLGTATAWLLVLSVVETFVSSVTPVGREWDATSFRNCARRSCGSVRQIVHERATSSYSVSGWFPVPRRESFLWNGSVMNYPSLVRSLNEISHRRGLFNCLHKKLMASVPDRFLTSIYTLLFPL
jgi:hypothetical protein